MLLPRILRIALLREHRGPLLLNRSWYVLNESLLSLGGLLGWVHHNFNFGIVGKFLFLTAHELDARVAVAIVTCVIVADVAMHTLVATLP